MRPADLDAEAGGSRRSRRVRAAALGLGLLAIVTGITSVQATEAAWTNVEHATTTVTAATLTGPTVVSCSYTATLTSFTATYTLSLPPRGVVTARLQELPLLSSTWTNVGPVRSLTGNQVALQHGALLGTFRTVFTVTLGGWTQTFTSNQFTVLANAVGSC